MGRPIGVPKTGIFGLLDLVGLDLQPHVDASLAAALPPDDPYQRIRRDFPLLHKLIAEGSTGRKGKGGFYRLDGGRRQYLTVDGTYADLVRPPGVLLLADVKLAGAPVATNGSASLW